MRKTRRLARPSFSLNKPSPPNQKKNTTTAPQAPAIAAAVATAVGARACASKVAAVKAAQQQQQSAVRVRVERGAAAGPFARSSHPPSAARARPFRFDE